MNKVQLENLIQKDVNDFLVKRYQISWRLLQTGEVYRKEVRRRFSVDDSKTKYHSGNEVELGYDERNKKWHLFNEYRDKKKYIGIILYRYFTKNGWYKNYALRVFIEGVGIRSLQ
jgi:hypothetical protein